MAFNQGVVINPAATRQPLGGAPVAEGLGQQGEQYMSEIHGLFWAAAISGNLFRGSTAAAGTTIPVSSATAATFTLYNPIGSGVNVELVRYISSVQNATLVVSSILLGISSPLTVAPTGLTALTSGPAIFGGPGVNKAQLYSVATITATTVFHNMGAYSATSGLMGAIDAPLFMHGIGIAPGTLVHVCGTAAQTSGSAQTFVWAEWPI